MEWDKQPIQLPPSVKAWKQAWNPGGTPQRVPFLCQARDTCRIVERRPKRFPIRREGMPEVDEIGGLVASKKLTDQDFYFFMSVGKY